MDIKVILGLGNPGPKFFKTRHNIGFRIIDALAQKYGGHWRTQGDQVSLKEIAEISFHRKNVFLIKPQTFMNNSGQALISLAKQGIRPENILVVHDELELPFGQLKIKTGGSAKGHNGLKSIITYVGDAFHRLRCGVGRPAEREKVPDYVLENFTESLADVDNMIDRAVQEIEKLFY